MRPEVIAKPTHEGSRPVRTLRAHEAEWRLIKQFADFVKAHGVAKAEELFAEKIKVL